MAVHRASQDEAALDKARAANRAQQADHKANLDQSAKDKVRATTQAPMSAADQAHKMAQIARKSTRLTKFDGFCSQEVLQGTFHVPPL